MGSGVGVGRFHCANGTASVKRQMLCWLLEQYAKPRTHITQRWSGGIQVTPDDSLSRSESAARSRAWRRLEERGLIKRLNHMTESSQRATHIALTDDGRAVAQSLIRTAAL